ncbi:GerMN domain-containing protein [Jeotgalibacillus malaysiensis]|uniref:GerMN domain-containing protein n=1 Tax=Jeotgalibacillus malaysiensis TaxID=1508404 RepID=UPI00384AD8F6
MTKRKWTEEEIENELKKFPEINSRIDPEEVYQHVKLRNRKIKPFHWMPVAAGTAAVALMAILAPGLFNEDASSDQQASDTALPVAEEESAEVETSEEASQDSSEEQNVEMYESSDADEVAENSEESSEEPAAEEEEELETVTIEEESEKGILFEEDLGNNMYFEAGLVTRDAFVIPFTFVVPQSEADQTPLSLYQEWADKIDEASFGFMDYHPISQNLSVEEGNVSGLIDNLDEKTQGASAALLIDVLKETFGSFYDQFSIIDENNEPAEIGEFGRVESYDLNHDNKGFYIYENEDGSYFYAKSYDQFSSVQEALNAIEEQVPNDQYASPVPENVDINYEVNGSDMTVSFEGDFTETTEIERRQLIESILLTAESFAISSVRFNGLEDEFLAGYSFDEPVNVPIGGNTAFLQ